MLPVAAVADSVIMVDHQREQVAAVADSVIVIDYQQEQQQQQLNMLPPGIVTSTREAPQAQQRAESNKSGHIVNENGGGWGGGEAYML